MKTKQKLIEETAKRYLYGKQNFVQKENNAAIRAPLDNSYENFILTQ